MGWKKTLIYRSKDKDDWDTAKKLLEEAGFHFRIPNTFSSSRPSLAGGLGGSFKQKSKFFEQAGRSITI